MKSSVFRLVINIMVSAILSAGALIYPEYSLLIIAVSSVFFAVSAYRGKICETAILLVASAVSVFAVQMNKGVNIDNICAGASLLCLLALGGTVLGLLTKYRVNFRMVIAGSTAAYLASYLIDFANLKFHHKLDLGEELINKPVETFINAYAQIFSAASPEGAQPIIEALGDIQWYMQQIMATITPSLLIVTCAFFAFATFLISRKIIYKKYSDVMEEYPPFCRLQLPKSASILLAVLFILTFFMNSSPLGGAVTNGIIILCTLYIICGISVVDFFLSKRNINWILRLIIYVFGFFISVVISLIIPVTNIFGILMFLGIIDTMSDFRRIRGEKYEA